MKHRGKHSSDKKLFGSAKKQTQLREAVKDLSFLLERGYAEKSASQLVGNRYKLNKRQRMAMQRMSCAQSDFEKRMLKHIHPTDLNGQSIDVDGFNLLISVEVALSKGYIFESLDGCYRDIASVHGTYKKVEETLPALKLIGKAMQDLKIEQVNWYFDSPVSNSGRLKGILHNLAQQNKYPWKIKLVKNPDNTLIQRKNIVVTSDGMVLDKAKQWSNLTKFVIDNYVKKPAIIRFYEEELDAGPATQDAGPATQDPNLI